MLDFQHKIYMQMVDFILSIRCNDSKVQLTNCCNNKLNYAELCLCCSIQYFKQSTV